MLYTFFISRKKILVIESSLIILLLMKFRAKSLQYENIQISKHLSRGYKPNYQLSNYNSMIIEIKNETFISDPRVDYYKNYFNKEYNNYQENNFKVINQQNNHDANLISNERLVKIDESFENKQSLNNLIANEACKLDRGSQRKDRLNETYLNYCNRFKLENLLSGKILMSIMHDSSQRCEKILNEFIQLDELINHFDNLFANLLTRYNCHNGYSVKWTCEDCQKAYKDWLCATNLPYYMNGEQVKPCISFCERVEQRCPYLHPIQKEQYGGQPTFICRDPNIPFVPEITPEIPYSEPFKCYDLCHLSDNLTELITDSLSKYDFDKCPDGGFIAEEVKREQLYFGQEDGLMQFNINKDTSNDLKKSQINNTGKELDFTGTYTSKNEVTLEVDLYNKKLIELREVLAIYKSQPKTHSFGSHD